MNKCEIHVDTSTLHRTDARFPIWGDVWITFDGLAFPSAHWSDIVIDFLSALTGAVIELSRNVGSSREVRFYDGPWGIALTRIADDGLRVVTFRQDITQNTYLVSISGFKRSLSAAAITILEACPSDWWQDSDVKQLAARVHQLS